MWGKTHVILWCPMRQIDLHQIWKWWIVIYFLSSLLLYHLERIDGTTPPPWYWFIIAPYPKPPCLGGLCHLLFRWYISHGPRFLLKHEQLPRYHEGTALVRVHLTSQETGAFDLGWSCPLENVKPSVPSSHSLNTPKEAANQRNQKYNQFSIVVD